MDEILEYLISQGIITQEEFDQKVLLEKEKLTSNPDSVQSKVEVLSEGQEINTLSILDTMVAIAQVYEEKEIQIQQREQELLDAMSAIAEVYEELLIIKSQINGG